MYTRPDSDATKMVFKIIFVALFIIFIGGIMEGGETDGGYVFGFIIMLIYSFIRGFAQ